MAHQQESFLPFFSPAKSLLLPKPHGKKEHPKATWFSLLSSKTAWSSPYSLCQSCMILPLYPKSLWSSLSVATAPRFKSQHPSSSAAPFPTPPTISYTGQHSRILPALLGCHSKSRQVWPHGVEPVFSKLSHRLCNQGELPPSYIMG